MCDILYCIMQSEEKKMGKFDGTLFCTDLDGTLLNSKKDISRENREAIEYFKSEGGLFTFVTGRMPYTSMEMYEMVRPNAPFGCINGGGIYDPTKAEYLWMNALPEEALSVIDYVYSNMPDIGIQLNCPERIYFTRDNSSMVHFREITDTPYLYKHHRELGAEPLSKVIFAHDDVKRVAEIRAEIEALPISSSFDFITASADFYELLPKGNSKGAVMTKLAEILGVDMRRTVAVGDYENDISMIKAAGIGYAVANAFPEAKAAADRITVSNNEHAIAAIIEELDSGRAVFPV